MIPSHWIRHHRREDHELLGYLRPVDGDPDQFVPVTLFGHPLGDPSEEAPARRRLDRTGLDYLAQDWLLSLPDHPEPIAVQIVEVTPQRMRVQNIDYGYPHANIGHLFVLDVPTPDQLRPR
ncbi:MULTISPECIES: hypothetical protein [Streptomyces]|uniref:Uncharacterized protein n=1 Tax=Streptomyces siderophoricus TaxID=2802281 RepID=A0ABS1N0K3_9ACTN|nr:hypothetical protein [Streptomyces sp. 9-7]MBL1093461.1 hypothetical protein [Streptomyces sp. 9-7]